MRKNASSDDEPLARKRGRPAGKNRVPLTADERRARNTQYERERRNDKAKAMAELAEAAGCESSISAPDLLNTVLNQIQNAANRKSTEDIDNLRRINDNLISQITKLENQLKLHCPEFEASNPDVNDASDSDQESTTSYDRTSRSTRLRNKKTVIKRKRKHQSQDSDSQDSVDASVGGDEEINKPKRFKSESETQQGNQEKTYLQETGSCASSQYSYETRSSNYCHREDELHTLYQTESYSQSNEPNQSLRPDDHASNIAISPPSGDTNVTFQPQLSSMVKCENWTADYCAANAIHQPQQEHTSEFDFRSMLAFQEPEIASERSNELLPLENLNFLEDGEGEIFYNQCEWWDSFFLNTNILENGENNLVYS